MNLYRRSVDEMVTVDQNSEGENGFNSEEETRGQG